MLRQAGLVVGDDLAAITLDRIQDRGQRNPLLEILIDRFADDVRALFKAEADQGAALVVDRRPYLVPQAQIQREAWRHLPVVLQIRGVFRPAEIEGRTQEV